MGKREEAVKFRVKELREEQIGKIKYMTESEIEEYIERIADSEQERKALRKEFKFWMENRKIESKIEEEKEVMVNEKYMNKDKKTNEEDMTNRVENLNEDIKEIKEMLRVFLENEEKVKMENMENGEPKKECEFEEDMKKEESLENKMKK